MTNTDRVLANFHAALVEEIRAQQPDYLTGPFTVAEIYQNLVPYGSHRDRIGVEMNGDYEDALLRLLAGEGGYLMLDSVPALKNLQEELESSNPNTGLYREFAAVDVRLNPALVDGDSPFTESAQVEPDLDATAEEGSVSMSDLAPPSAADESTPQEESGVDSTSEGTDADAGDSPSACRWCRAELPQRESMNYCPFCGTDVNVVPCPGCGEELESEWRFCVACGTEVDA